ncbi:MAG TPA: alpha/beta-type small acid-soluble spore protein [Clostridia bacterium]|nr:alpha/beta-type small acid-soluble spore protein [Clostridia bacterium]
MAQGQKRNQVIVREAAPAMNTFKYEVARDLNVSVPASDYWGDLSSRDCGAVGGHMVRRMIEMAERSLAGTAAGGGARPGGQAR